MRIILILFLITTIFYSAVAFILLRTHKLETYEYDEIALNLLDKKVFMCHRLGTEYYSLVPPLYPFFYAVIYLFFDYSKIAVLISQIVLMGLISIIVYFIAKDIFGNGIALLSAVLTIAHPGLAIYTVTKLHELIFATFIFLSVILIIIKLGFNFSYKRAFMIGLLIGLAVLTRATIIGSIPFILIWLFLINIKNYKFKSILLKQILLMIITIVVVISPWVLRNYFLHRKFIFIQTPSIDLWVGNNPNATGGNFLEDGKTVFESMDPAFVRKILKSDEITQDRLFKEEVYRFIRTHPVQFIKLYFKKLYYFWWFSSAIGTKYPYMYLKIYKIYYIIILSLVSVSFIYVFNTYLHYDKKILDKVLILIMVPVGISLLQGLFYIEGRHRWSVEPVLLILASSGFLGIIHDISFIFKKRSLNNENHRL